MNIKELETQLLALKPTEKAQAIHLLAQSFDNNWKGIEKTPGVCGGTACIANTRIPVWVLVNARRLGISEAQLLQDYPTLSAADLVNAWIYAEVYADEIELAIRQNEEDWWHVFMLMNNFPSGLWNFYALLVMMYLLYRKNPYGEKWCE